MTLGSSKSNEGIWPETMDRFLHYHLPGQSASVRLLRNTIAPLNSITNRELVRVVLISGESGAGKNHVARVMAAHRFWLQEQSRAEAEVEVDLDVYTQRFHEILIPSLTDTLVESELFGHKKGAFTGADRETKGLMAEALDDILLDEIGDATEVVQAKLLGLIETRRFRKVGAGLDEEEETTARLLLATHRDLAARVQSGQFREDLYWRAVEFHLQVPPLREQPENITSMVSYQLKRLLPVAMYSSDPKDGLREPPKLKSTDLEWAAAYPWPGNVRQLRHTLVRWLAAGGHAPLRTVALEVEAMMPHRAIRATGSMSRREVWARLDEGIENETPAAQRLSDLVDTLRGGIEKEIVAWYDERKPSADKVKALFPDMKPSSVVSKLSQWRNR